MRQYQHFITAPTKLWNAVLVCRAIKANSSVQSVFLTVPIQFHIKHARQNAPDVQTASVIQTFLLIPLDIKERPPERVIVKRVAPHIHTVVRRDIMVLHQTVHPGAAHAPVVAHHPRAQHRQRVAISHRGPRVLIPRVRTNIHRIVIGRTKTPTCFSPKKHSPILGECFVIAKYIRRINYKNK